MIKRFSSKEKIRVYRGIWEYDISDIYRVSFMRVSSPVVLFKIAVILSAIFTLLLSSF